LLIFIFKYYNLMDKMKTICERCKNKYADFVCYICEPLKAFCSGCDTTLHSLPSKKNHKRDSIDLYGKSPRSNRDEVYMEQDTNYMTLQSKRNLSNNIDNMGSAEFHGKITFTGSPRQQMNLRATSNDEQAYSNLDAKFKMTDFNKMYTREYVNELKSLHQKEKDELIFKHNALQNNLNRLKTSFSDQILELQKQVDENKHKNNHMVKMNEEETSSRFKGQIVERDNAVKNLKKQIEEFKECNEELLARMNKTIKIQKEDKNDCSNKLNEYENLVQEKEIEIKNLKNYYEDKLAEKHKQASSMQGDIEQYDIINFRIIFNHKKEINSLRDELSFKDKESIESFEKQKQEELTFMKNINEVRSENEDLNRIIKKCKLKV
jgi:hypothetical protein